MLETSIKIFPIIFINTHVKYSLHRVGCANKDKRSDAETYSFVQPVICAICDEIKIDKTGCVGALDLVIDLAFINVLLCT